MSKVNAIIKPLVEKFVTLASEVQSRRFAMGDLVCQMLEVTEGSYAPIVRALKAQIPDAKMVLGYAITKPNLEAMATMAATFREGDGLLSPDGKHMVFREDVEALNLTPAESQKMAELVSTGDLRLKTVASAAKAAKGGGKRAVKAIDNLRVLIQHDGTKPTGVISLDDLRKALKRKQDQIDKLTAEATELEVEVQKREQAMRETVEEANESTSTKSTAAAPIRQSDAPRVRKQKGSKKSRKADATVSA